MPGSSGLAAAVIALVLRAPFLVVVLVAAVTAARTPGHRDRSMNEPRKPIFGFLWPKPDPNAPVDGAYRQVRRVRITPARSRPARDAVPRLRRRRHGERLAHHGGAHHRGLRRHRGRRRAGGLGDRAHPAGLGGRHLRQRRGRSPSRPPGAVPRSRGRRCGRSPARPCRAPFLGLPVRVATTRSMVTTTDGATVATHVYGCSPDLWLRARGPRHGARGCALERWLPSGAGPSPQRASAGRSGVVQRDRAAHRRPRPLAIAGVVVADGQPVPAAPVVRCRLHLLLVLDEPRIGCVLLDAARRRARQVVDRQAALARRARGPAAGCAGRRPARARAPTRR